MAFINGNKSRKSYLPDINNYQSTVSADEEEDEEKGPQEEVLGWDVFKYYPPKLKTGSKADKGLFDFLLKSVKFLTYSVLFVLVLSGGIIAKGAILFAASQINDHGPVDYCDYNDAEQRPGGRNLSAAPPEESRITWYWCIFLAFIVPEALGLFDALYHCLFKKRAIPKFWDLTFSLLIDSLHVIGLSILFLCVIPELNAIQAMVVASCTCVVPGFMGVLSPMRDRTRGIRGRSFIVFIGDVVAFSGQLCGILVWLIPDDDVSSTTSSKWLLPISLILTSCRWWGNYVSPYSAFGFIRSLSRIKTRLQASRGITMACTGVCRILVFLVSFIVIAYYKDITPSRLFDAANFRGDHNVTIFDLTRVSSTSQEIGVTENAAVGDTVVGYRTVQTYYLPLIVLVVQAASAFLAYSSSKFACRTLMQGFGFAFPLSLVVPGTIVMIVVFCTLRERNSCVFHGFLPDYVFFNAPADIDSLGDLLGHWYLWIWVITLLSQAWITRHIWEPHPERLAATERLFFAPTYDSLIIDQSIVLNRQMQEDISEDDPTMKRLNPDAETADEGNRSKGSTETNYYGVEKSDRTTRIIVCATMWHEIEDEMIEFVGSILRLDTDQGTKRFTQGYYNVELRRYYELETHVFFDDAFRCMHDCKRSCSHDENETVVNDYVLCLIDTMKKMVERRNISATPPMKYPAPYGGRLEWILPGKTKMIVHLKDKNKIRHRKRWSQVMYMYYLLGYRLMDRPISRDRKVTIAENTFLLALDGDIDFLPSAVKVLVDLMKRDKDLGAACGRIHPIGSGPMVWFQKFEYAIGHWLQKSTEHTIGSVLCSPGCFSLFRARALMEHNVMRKYAIQATEPRHYVQYDQGEDRWLCTLLLQIGYRVEYSAASDSYTHAPETFNEFYNQRRRWIPSTIANIFDLLNSSEETRKVNNDISWLYVAYQWILMGSTVLGPGTIFLMLVGAFVAAFRIDNWSSFGYNLIPIAIFVIVCATCKADIQLMVAGIISAFYGLVMIVVLVGIMIQIAEDGWVAPSTILFFVVAGQIVIAGLLHPQEWTCLLCGLIYYVTVPSMYLLLIIFSLFNVNNVTWGTRDSKAAEPTEKEKAAENGRPRNEKPTAKDNKSNSSKPKERGAMEFSLAGLFKCMLCTQNTQTDEDRKFEILTESLDRIGSRLDAMEKNSEGHDAPKDHRDEKFSRKPNDFDGVETPGASVMQDDSDLDDSDQNTDDGEETVSDSGTNPYANESTRESGNFLVSPCWLQDEKLRKGGVEFLSREEEIFWDGLIEKYLHPIDEDKAQKEKIAEGLKALRDEYVFKFFMVNALFVLIVFLMQLKKEVLHFEWPLGATYNITYEPTGMEVQLSKDYLKLEPIGCLFIVGFMLVLGVQFIAMLFHRWNTFAHMLANTSIDWCACKKKADQTAQDDLEKHAEDLADDLQRVVEENAVPIFARKATSVSPGKRTTVHDLADGQDKRTKLPSNIDTLFRKNLNDPKSEITRLMSTRMPRHIFEALEQRHSTVVAEHRRSQGQPHGLHAQSVQQPETDTIYHVPNNLPGGSQNRPSAPIANGTSYDNAAFASSDESNDDLPSNHVTIPHRPSQVKFGKLNT